MCTPSMRDLKDSQETRLSKKSARIAALIKDCAGRQYDPHYLGYFKCFNDQLFYEAHDVLEELWLAERRGANDGFYKALIQLAGAFVHLQKNRLRPAGALFKLAKKYLTAYPPIHERLDVTEVNRMIDDWLQKLEASDFSQNPLEHHAPPRLELT